MTVSLVRGQSSRHVCAVAHTEDERARVGVEWVREGLALGERVVWVDPDSEATLERMRRHGLEWQSAIDRGALRIAHPGDVVRLGSTEDVPRRIAGAADLTRQALDDGYRGLRVGVETAVALTVMPDTATQFAFEAAWERLTRVERLSLLCLYDPAVYGEGLHRGVELHPREFTDGLADLAAGAGVVEIGGELDVSNSALAGRFLAVADVGQGDVTVHMAHCDFVDVSGTAELVAFARARRPRSVRLLQPPPSLVRILGLTDQDHHFELVERGA